MNDKISEWPNSFADNSFLCLQPVGARGAVRRLRHYLDRQWRAMDTQRLSVFGLARRTNNDAECFFSVFGADFAAAHPSFWSFVAQLNVVRNKHMVRQYIWNVPIALIVYRRIEQHTMRSIIHIHFTCNRPAKQMITNAHSNLIYFKYKY